MNRTTDAYQPPRSPGARGWRRFTIGMCAYAVIVLLQGLLLDPGSLAWPVAVAMALLPVASAVWAMTGWLAAIRTFDEFQQKVISEAGLVALGVTAILTFTYGFLESLAGAPKLSMFIVFPVMALCYVVATPFVKRRFR